MKFPFEKNLSILFTIPHLFGTIIGERQNFVPGGTKMKTSLLAITLILSSIQANAGVPIRILPTANTTHTATFAAASEANLINGLNQLFGTESLREIRARVVYSADHADHVLVYLYSKTTHSFKYASVKFDSALNLTTVTRDYHLQAADHAAQNGINAANAKCPDPTVQMLAVCPNDDSLELNVTNEVAAAAHAKGLKTQVILKTDLTHDAYLNWMTCPNLKGNFYDGDANTDVLSVSDGEITASEFSTILKAKFRYKVVNIWLACEAYNDPMLTAIRDTDQSQKYAAGVNDLDVGPSDEAGACAMEAAIAGKPMTAAFQDCYKRMDNTKDQWGFGGKGSDTFGQ
jgi:hypothetical protein